MSQLTDNVQLGVDCHTYKWYLYQVERFHGENDTPCAVFFHEEEARLSFDHLSKRYDGIPFVLTNINSGESYCG